jgi:hypothetical protein
MIGVVVLGMHRSGTSAVARAVNLLGVPFGDGRIVPVTLGNPMGHWESWELQEINDEVLAAFGGSWAGPPTLAKGWELDPRLDALCLGASEVWRAVHSSDGWVWKDPRTCLTLPFWRRIAGLEGPAIVIYREPGSVAASLARRDGFSDLVSTALWERYNRAALESIAGWPAMVVSYERLLQDPGSWAVETRTFLGDHGVAFPAGVSDRDAIKEIRAGQLGPCGPVGDLSAAQRSLLECLHALEGCHQVFDPPVLVQPSPWMDALLIEHGRAYDQELRLRADLARARSQLGHVLNRTRMKVLAYRAYTRLVDGRGPSGGFT